MRRFAPTLWQTMFVPHVSAHSQNGAPKFRESRDCKGPKLEVEEELTEETIANVTVDGRFLGSSFQFRYPNRRGYGYAEES